MKVAPWRAQVYMGPLAQKSRGKGKGKGKDMVRCANQSYIVRFAHGLWLSNVLKVVIHRRRLYLNGVYMYSRPHDQLYPRARGNVYSRPRAESSGSAAFPFGCQKSGRKEFLYIV